MIHALLGLALVLVLLYFWLLGHWFARILTFLMFGAAGTLLALVLKHGDNPGPEIAAIVIGFVGGWFIASLPTYYWRYELRRQQRVGW